MAADGGGVEAGVDAGEEDDEVFGDEIRDELVVRGEELGFGGFPGGGQCPIHRAAPWRVFCPRHGVSIPLRRDGDEPVFGVAEESGALPLGKKLYPGLALRRLRHPPYCRSFASRRFRPPKRPGRESARDRSAAARFCLCFCSRVCGCCCCGCC